MLPVLTNVTLVICIIGIWPEGADGTDVNACTRSSHQHLVASGDDFGKVNLFAYPSCKPKVIVKDILDDLGDRNTKYVYLEYLGLIYVMELSPYL